MNKKSGFDPTTGAWNDSLTSDDIWSRTNFGEAWLEKKRMLLGEPR